jgi:hypothetical protein
MGNNYKPAYLAHFENRDREKRLQEQNRNNGEASGAAGPAAITHQNIAQPSPMHVAAPHLAIGAAAPHSPAMQYHKSFLDGDFESVSFLF